MKYESLVSTNLAMSRSLFCNAPRRTHGSLIKQNLNWLMFESLDAEAKMAYKHMSRSVFSNQIYDLLCL